MSSHNLEVEDADGDLADLLKQTPAFSDVDPIWLRDQVSLWSSRESSEAASYAQRMIEEGGVPDAETPLAVLRLAARVSEFPHERRSANSQMRQNKTEMVEHPAHYGGKDDPYETIKVLHAWLPRLPLNALEGGLMFNVIKYLSRAGLKNDLLEDLRKTRWYLNDLIDVVEKRR